MTSDAPTPQPDLRLQIDEAGDLSVDTPTLPDEYDRSAVEVIGVVYFVTRTLEEISAALDAGETVDVSQDALDLLQEGFYVGERLLECQETFLRDPEAVDGDLLTDVKRTLVPIGEAYGADMTMPSAVDVEDSDARDRPDRTYWGAS